MKAGSFSEMVSCQPVNILTREGQIRSCTIRQSYITTTSLGKLSRTSTDSGDEIWAGDNNKSSLSTKVLQHILHLLVESIEEGLIFCKAMNQVVPVFRKERWHIISFLNAQMIPMSVMIRTLLLLYMSIRGITWI